MRSTIWLTGDALIEFVRRLGLGRRVVLALLMNVSAPALPRHATGRFSQRVGLLRVDTVEKLVWRSGASTAAKFDLIEWPLLNATRSGDGL
jgi:hypothetical protein